ncbi:MAG TPA: proline racemase family protein [Candidatus Acidoferrales bacterium]|nr:proline racemase family protein [Candidatus Acidoferrales bacterium]
MILQPSIKMPDKTFKTLQKVRVIDSHTGGEPTRVVIDGGPDLGDGPLSERLRRFRSGHDSFRSAVVNEPRGSDVMVGALLCKPTDPSCAAGVIFFNNVGYLGMCGHGTIGLVATLSHMKNISAGEHRIETPVGIVGAILHPSGEVTVNNVSSYRLIANVEIDVPEYGKIHGDVAWGGNWFFLVRDHRMELSLKNIDELTDFTWAIRQALMQQGITGAGNQEIDHVEIFGPPISPSADSKNFVLCPGKAYDRSPCGTGTSAKLACLYSDGKIHEGQVWTQESIVGSVFEGTISVRDGKMYPSIKGSAFVNSEADLLLDPRDPFCLGIRT